MRLAIIGPGLIGRSVALAARRAQPDAEIVEIDRGQPLALAAGADHIVVSAPVDAILALIHADHQFLRAAVVMDTGSTKRQIVTRAREAGLTTFVGGHPMAGAAASGPDAARADLFDGRPWFLIPHGADPAAVGRARALVELLGARPVTLDDDGSTHDRIMAGVSHLPQVVASLLMTLAAEAAGDAIGWAGAGLRDTTRLAGSGAAAWESILSSNAAALAPLLRTFGERITALAHELDDPAAVRRLFADANHARAELMRSTVKADGGDAPDRSQRGAE